MLPVVLEAAIRSTALIAAIWFGLKLLRVQNPNILMVAWRLVLFASLLMPLLAGWAIFIWPPATLAFLQILSSEEAMLVASAAEPVFSEIQSRAVDWHAIASSIYLLVGGLLLLRLMVGLALAWRLCRSATPIRGSWTDGCDVRASAFVKVPVTFGSIILLPDSHAGWDRLQRRAVMAHERAHIARGDFYVLLFASINSAIFWFNPLAWWLHGRIADLAEETSDAVAIRDIEDRPRYAQILIDFSRKAPPAVTALSMARPKDICRRVERILAETTLPRDMDWKAWCAMFALILPLVAVAAGVLAQVPSAQAPSAGDEKKAATVLDPDTLAQRRKDQRRPRKEIQLDPKVLDNFAGYFQLGPLAMLTVTRQGEHLFVQRMAQRPVQVYPESPQKFFYRRVPAQISFTTDTQGRATGLVLHQNGLEVSAKRVDQAQAKKIEESFAKRLKDAAPLPGSEAALRRQIEAFIQGQPAYGEMTEELAVITRPQVPTIRHQFALLGPLQSISFRGVGLQGWDIYEAKFANGISISRIAMRTDGKISGLLFQWGP